MRGERAKLENWNSEKSLVSASEQPLTAGSYHSFTFVEIFCCPWNLPGRAIYIQPRISVPCDQSWVCAQPPPAFSSANLQTRSRPHTAPTRCGRRRNKSRSRELLRATWKIPRMGVTLVVSILTSDASRETSGLSWPSVHSSLAHVHFIVHLGKPLIYGRRR